MPETPLADAVDAYINGGVAAFTTPGHHRAPGLVELDPLLAHDAPLIGGADDLRGSGDLLHRAERLAATTFGAGRAWFGVNGSTHPNQALCLVAGGAGDRVVVARTSHRSVFAGMVLAGFDPVWVAPDLDPDSGFALSIRADQIASALDANPDARTVMLVEPSWLGLLSDREAIAEVAHARGAALICDQAWGAHYGLHPDLPPSGLAVGVDAIAVSVHKTLPAFTQTALMLSRAGGVLDERRLNAAFETLATTSPSASIMASIDRARAYLDEHAHARYTRSIALAEQARERLRALPGVRTLDRSLCAQPSVADYDPLKLTIDVSATGADGIEIDGDLRAAGVMLEGADRTLLVPLLTLADDEAAIDRLVGALAASLERRAGTARRASVASTVWRVVPEQVMTPREAFFAPHERVPAERAAGRIAAEVAAPYPPGIPALAPGERIPADLLAELREEARGGQRISGVSDPTLATVLVVA